MGTTVKARTTPRRDANAYPAIWERFARMKWTQDSLADERRGWRHWLLTPVVAFIIPLDDPAVCAQLESWQRALAPWLAYDPQPAERLHITLHIAGRLSPLPWLPLPRLWRRRDLHRLAETMQTLVHEMDAFAVGIGPLNAFPGVLFAEVQDTTGCLRTLRLGLRRGLPLRARPPLRWPFVPHVTLGFWGRQPVGPLVGALTPYRQVDSVPLRVEAVRLTVYSQNDGPPRVDLLQTAR
jgi:2'-5' RNA ligase